MTNSYLQVSRNGKTLEIVFDKPKVNAICATSIRELALAAPLALAAIKEVARESERMSLEEYYRSMRAGNWPTLDKCLNGEDFREGIAAFAEKRGPNWRGR